MTLDVSSLSVAFGFTAGVFWTVYSAIVAVLPGPTMGLSGHMFHANLQGLNWTLTWGGFLMGLISWTICAAVAGWLIGWTYNYLYARRSQ